MNSSAFIPAQFASAAHPSTSDTSLYDANTLSFTSTSGLDGFVDPQSSVSSQAVPLGWPYPGSEFDTELYKTFLAGELAHPEPCSYEPYIDPSFHPGSVCAFAHDAPYALPVQASSPDYGYNVSLPYDTLNPSTPQLVSVPRAYRPPTVPATPCIAPAIALAELSVYSEPYWGPANDNTVVDATSHNVRHTRAMISHRATVHANSDTPLPYPSPSPEPFLQVSSELIACQRRNAPASPSTATSSNRWKCPHCPYIQRNRRSPDLKRHVETHTRDAHVASWVCCGVPADNALELGVPSEAIRDAPLFDFEGMTMVGGCRKVFSRRDALIRHLRKREGACYGDAGAVYQPGNRTAMYS